MVVELQLKPKKKTQRTRNHHDLGAALKQQSMSSCSMLANLQCIQSNMIVLSVMTSKQHPMSFAIVFAIPNLQMMCFIESCLHQKHKLRQTDFRAWVLCWKSHTLLIMWLLCLKALCMEHTTHSKTKRTVSAWHWNQQWLPWWTIWQLCHTLDTCLSDGKPQSFPYNHVFLPSQEALLQKCCMFESVISHCRSSEFLPHLLHFSNRIILFSKIWCKQEFLKHQCASIMASLTTFEFHCCIKPHKTIEKKWNIWTLHCATSKFCIGPMWHSLIREKKQWSLWKPH